MLFLFMAALSAVSASDEEEMQLWQGCCPGSWYSFNSRCYKYIATHMTWIDAELHCLSTGSNLVSIHSQEEENFVKHLIKSYDHAEGFTWIGLTDCQKNYAWLWSDGTPFDFECWSRKQPNNYKGLQDCVYTNGGKDKKWNDRKCFLKFSFVCATRRI